MNNDVDLFGTGSSNSNSKGQGSFGGTPQGAPQGGFQGGGFNSNFNRGGGLPFKNPQQESPKVFNRKGNTLNRACIY